jgi:hypothetical protein
MDELFDEEITTIDERDEDDMEFDVELLIDRADELLTTRIADELCEGITEDATLLDWEDATRLEAKLELAVGELLLDEPQPVNKLTTNGILANKARDKVFLISSPQLKIIRDRICRYFCTFVSMIVIVAGPVTQ